MICAVCTKEFRPLYKTPSGRLRSRKRPAQRCCSKRCSRASRIVPRFEKDCKQCGNKFIRRVRSINDHRPQAYCSRQCLYDYLREHAKPAPIAGSRHWTKMVRMSLEYRKWRKAVIKLHGQRCWDCGVSKRESPKTYFDADHIIAISIHPELVFDVENSRILCRPCHRKTDTWGHKATLKKRQYEALVASPMFSESPDLKHPVAA